MVLLKCCHLASVHVSCPLLGVRMQLDLWLMFDRRFPTSLCAGVGVHFKPLVCRSTARRPPGPKHVHAAAGVPGAQGPQRRPVGRAGVPDVGHRVSAGVDLGGYPAVLSAHACAQPQLVWLHSLCGHVPAVATYTCTAAWGVPSSCCTSRRRTHFTEEGESIAMWMLHIMAAALHIDLAERAVVLEAYCFGAGPPSCASVLQIYFGSCCKAGKEAWHYAHWSVVCRKSH